MSINDELTATQPLEGPVNVSSVNGTDLIEVPGLRENTRYSATVSAHNNFSFSIENPLTSDPVMFGEWSLLVRGCGPTGNGESTILKALPKPWKHGVSPHLHSVSVPYSDVWSPVCDGISV